ncbi:MAG: leucine-rich repeat domain-containing protein [Chloroflexota bacterium]
MTTQIINTTMRTITRLLILTAICILWTSAPHTFVPFTATAQSQTVQSQPAQTEFDCTTVSEIPQAECEALVAIYNGTGGPDWTVSTDWLQTTTPCGWFGVTCSDGRVAELDLDNEGNSNNLTGALPAAIGDLGNLTSLDLGPNQLSSIPTEIDNLSNLTTLYLYSNQLSSIPTEIGNLSNLTTLYLSSNQLSSIPTEIGNLSNLTRLSLDNNQLSSIPTEIGNLSELALLYLNQNQLNSLPSSVVNLTNLQYLSLQNNQLNNLPSGIGNFSNMIELWLYNNQLSEVPPEIGNLVNLKQLVLYSNQIRTVPTGIGNLSNLNLLALSHNQLESIPSELGNLSSLTWLSLSDNQLSEIPPTLGNLSNLEWLSLNNNQLTHLPSEIGNLVSLQEVYFDENALVNIPSQIGSLSNLTALGLSSNQLVGLPSTFINLTNLAPDSLNVANNHLLNVNTQLRDFLDEKDPDWANTQTSPANSTPVPPSVTPPIATPTPAPTATPIHTVSPTLTPTPVSIDPYEPDNQCNLARQIQPNGIAQTHTFHEVADTDWIFFQAPHDGVYQILVDIPYGSRADVDFTYYNRCNSQAADHWFEPFTSGVRLNVNAAAGQTFYMELMNFDASVAGPDVVYNISVHPLTEEPATGALIVVAGRLRTTDVLQDNINILAQIVFQLFNGKNVEANDIKFLATNSSLTGYDEHANLNNLEHAITEWAADRVSSSQALTLYLVDHGRPEKLYLDTAGSRNEVLTPTLLNQWLTELESKVPGLKSNIIIEACNSGSFIEFPESISRENRVVITSANANDDANTWPEGAPFTNSLLIKLGTNYNLADSFETAKTVVDALYPFQQPWLDANGNGIPNEHADREIAATRSFATDGSLPPDHWPPFIAQTMPPTTIHNSSGLIQAEVRDDEGVERVQAYVYPPSYTPPVNDGELNVESDVYNFNLTRNMALGDDMYQGRYPAFIERGLYRIVIHATDGDGLQAQPAVMHVDTTPYRVFLPTVQR